MRHHDHGAPPKVIRAAFAAIDSSGLSLARRSPVIASQPIGPSRRRFANAAAVVSTDLDPPGVLQCIQAIERTFGRKRAGQRWGARVLDIDIVLWDGGTWASNGLVVPHEAFREREFVLTPAASIAPEWRDPITGLTLRQLRARLTRPFAIPR